MVRWQMLECLHRDQCPVGQRLPSSPLHHLIFSGGKKKVSYVSLQRSVNSLIFSGYPPKTVNMVSWGLKFEILQPPTVLWANIWNRGQKYPSHLHDQTGKSEQPHQDTKQMHFLFRDIFYSKIKPAVFANSFWLLTKKCMSYISVLNIYKRL